MFGDGVFLVNNVTSENFQKISKKQSVLEEQRICELSELVDALVDASIDMNKDGYGIYEILSVISESLSSSYSHFHDTHLSENFSRLKSYFEFVDVYDKGVLSEFFVERMRKRGVNVSESDFLPQFTGDSNFTYVKNSLADEAFDVFSQRFPEPKVKYVDTLKNAVRAVADGESEFCLLPLEERGGARLSSVASLIYQDDLKITSVTPVFGFDGLADMKYALVSRHFSIPTIEEDDDRYLEIRIAATSAMSLSELLVVADSLDIMVYRVNTIAFDTDDGALTHYSIVFKCEGRDFSSLLVFLTLFSKVYTAVGIYNNLE